MDRAGRTECGRKGQERFSLRGYIICVAIAAFVIGFLLGSVYTANMMVNKAVELLPYFNVVPNEQAKYYVEKYFQSGYKVPILPMESLP